MSIPTIGVREIQFRSRLEAQWASVFEQLMWNWEYEPFDMNGYIPDFIITFAGGRNFSRSKRNDGYMEKRRCV